MTALISAKIIRYTSVVTISPIIVPIEVNRCSDRPHCPLRRYSCRKIGAVKRLCVVISDLADKAQSKRGCYLHLAYRHVYTTDAVLPQQICDIQREHQRKYKCGAPYAPLLRDTFKKAPEKKYIDKRIDNTDGHGYERYEHVFAVNTVQIAYHSENRAFQNTHLRVCAANIMP